MLPSVRYTCSVACQRFQTLTLRAKRVARLEMHTLLTRNPHSDLSQDACRLRSSRFLLTHYVGVIREQWGKDNIQQVSLDATSVLIRSDARDLFEAVLIRLDVFTSVAHILKLERYRED